MKEEDNWASWPQKFILCDCGEEGLFMLKNGFTEEPWAEEEVYFNFAKLGRWDYTLPLKTRIKKAWEIISKKHPFPDELIIKKKQAQEIVDFLNKYLLNEESNQMGGDKSS